MYRCMQHGCTVYTTEGSMFNNAKTVNEFKSKLNDTWSWNITLLTVLSLMCKLDTSSVDVLDIYLHVYVKYVLWLCVISLSYHHLT